MLSALDRGTRSLAAEFRRALNAGDVDVARETARRISPPDLSAFSFKNFGSDGGDRGTLTEVGKFWLWTHPQ